MGFHFIWAKQLAHGPELTELQPKTVFWDCLGLLGTAWDCLGLGLGLSLEMAINPKPEGFDSNDLNNIAREWDFTSFEQNSSLTDQNWLSYSQKQFFGTAWDCLGLLGTGLGTGLGTAINPKREGFYRKDVSKIAREWDSIHVGRKCF